MAIMIWTPDMSVGVASIDAQHKSLIAMVNTLYSASKGNWGAAIVGKTLESLIDDTVEHFHYEERLFRETNYPEEAAAAHVKEHDELINALAEVVARYNRGAVDALSEDTLLFLVTWLMDHIMGKDKDYSVHFVAAGIE
jgi:hemerythrin